MDEETKKPTKTDPSDPSDPFDRKRKKLLERIEMNKHGILISNKKIEMIDLLQITIKLFSGAKVVNPEKDLRPYQPLKINLPDLETLGAFFRELEYLKARMLPKAELTYSGEVNQDILAKVTLRFKDPMEETK